MIFDQSIFRSYDMRGVYPTAMNEDVAYATGQAFVKVMKAKTVAVGQDVRASGQSLKASLIRGITDAGANVIDVGVISTEMLYFASATLDCDGGMSVTASHNPAQWNGTKFIGKGGIPLTRDGQLGEIYAAVNSHEAVSEFEKGTVVTRDLLADYAEYLQRYVVAGLPQLKVVANVNFGANGKAVDAATGTLPLELVRLNWNEDGTFPKGTPDPLLPKNRKELSERVVSENANFGVAWDADADRCFFYDEKGRPFPGYYINALLTKHFLNLEPGATVILDPRQFWAILDAIGDNGKAVLSKVGHAYIKQAMREHGAIFGGEVSGHFYFRDFWRCDNGLITFLTVMGIFGQEIAK